jgi:hypothetical protein
VNMALNLQVPWNVGKLLTSWATGGFSRRTQIHGEHLLIYQSVSLVTALNICYEFECKNYKEIGELRSMNGKRKVKFAPLLSKLNTTPWRSVWGSGYKNPYAFLTSVIFWGEWSASHPGRFTSEERDLGTYWIGGWVGPRVGLEEKKRKFLILPELERRPFDHPARSQSLYRPRYPVSRI